MSKRQRVWTALIFIFFSLLIFYFLSKDSEVVKQRPVVDLNNKSPQIQKTPLPAIETRKEEKIKHVKDCDEIMVEKIAGTCDQNCLAESSHGFISANILV